MAGGTCPQTTHGPGPPYAAAARSQTAFISRRFRSQSGIADLLGAAFRGWKRPRAEDRREASADGAIGMPKWTVSLFAFSRGGMGGIWREEGVVATRPAGRNRCRKLETGQMSRRHRPSGRAARQGLDMTATGTVAFCR